MNRDRVRLHDALSNAYKECLRQSPSSVFRVHHQTLFAELRDALAALDGNSSESTQEFFEMLVATENDED